VDQYLEQLGVQPRVEPAQIYPNAIRIA
jgi:hypothetical protein